MKISLTASISPESFGPILLRGAVRDIFLMAAQWGYDGVELHLLHPAEIDRDEVKRLQLQHGLGIPTLGTGMAARVEGLTFSDPDPDIRHRAVKRIREQIELAAFLGSAVTLGSLLGRVGTESAERTIRREGALACLEECCEAADEAGVTLLLEPLNRYENDYLNTFQEALDVMTKIRRPNLKLLADTFHMNIEEADMEGSLRKAASYLGLVHLADSNRQAPGHGHLDVDGILKTLRDLNYEGYLSFEVLPLPNPRQAAEDGICLVRRILSRL
jgi:5-keto-L-gluconate epimerase